MPVMIYLPETNDIHGLIKRRARRARCTINDWILRAIERELDVEVIPPLRGIRPRLSSEQVTKVKKLLAEGVPALSLAELYGVPVADIVDIRRGVGKYCLANMKRLRAEERREKEESEDA